MNSAQMHLALTHVPVLLSITGLIMLLFSFIINSRTLTKTSYVIIAIAGIAAIPVYLTGEETEEAIENLPGVSEKIISEHQEVAMWAMISVAIAGAIALFAFFSFKWPAVARVSKIFVLIATLATGGLMVQTAQLGGQIRHSEIRNATTAENGKGEGNKEAVSKEQSGKKDDD
jgi:hypothetical protein